MDLFRCESIVLRSYWVLVVMDQFTRRLVGVGVHGDPVNSTDLCRMFNVAIHGRGTPRHLSTDHDPLFEAHRWTANFRILEIDEIKTVPHVPLSHPFVERLVGTMRREFLDHVLFLNARDLERKPADFQAYYNAARSHASLEGHTPVTFAGGHTVARAELKTTAGTWSSSQWRPDDEFETDRAQVTHALLLVRFEAAWTAIRPVTRILYSLWFCFGAV
ncbi:MAG TPA: integrase core domain-containing protein [Vicinamibacterales bacterium]|nr:integrase core domain-containing protein [Vicinamibacterales bacterium]